MGVGDFAKRVLVVVLILSLCMALWTARSILLLAFASSVIAIAMAQPMLMLQKRGVHRGLAVLAAVIFSIAVFVALTLWIVPTLANGVGELVNDLPAAVEKGKAAYSEWWNANPSVRRFMPPLTDVGTGMDASAVQKLFSWLVKSGMAIAPDVLGGVGLLVGVLVNVGLVLFIAIFFLIEPKSYTNALLYLFPPVKHDRVRAVISALYSTLTKWLHAQLFSVTVIVILVYVILGGFLGMPNAIVVALFAGLATFIPNIGAVLPILPITIFTIAYSDPSKLLLYIPIYLGIQFLESNVITPQVVRAQLNIPAGYLMLFQVLITLALGALGLVLAVPLLACMIVLVRETYSYDVLKLRNVKVSGD